MNRLLNGSSLEFGLAMKNICTPAILLLASLCTAPCRPDLALFRAVGVRLRTDDSLRAAASSIRNLLNPAADLILAGFLDNPLYVKPPPYLYLVDLSSI